ncbi:MAG TPA: sialidase family protein, partial [Cyclobacteriaceae bacterium]|nr:sialidase family protein [Cyclobacteriaceae bacterium]
WTGWKIYVAWSNQGIIYLDRSYDGGVTWLSNDISITRQKNGLMHIPGFNSTHDVPLMVIDCSMTRRQGYTYMTFVQQKNGPDDTDVVMIRSLDHGDHWTVPLKVNQDSTKTHQFMPAMAVDQTNGNVYVVYYDRRAYEDLQTDVYLSYSFDGGSSFKDVKISESPFTPTGAQLPGELISISAHAGIIAPVWVRMEGGKASVWTTVIKEEMLKK